MKRVFFILALLTIIFMLPFLLKPEYLTARQNDLDENFYPIVQIWKRSLFENHSFPLWRDDILGGYPFVIDPQPFMYYPLNWFLLFLPFEQAAIMLFGFHLWLLSFGTYIWLSRSWRASSPMTARLGAIAIGFTPFVIAHIASGHLNMVEALSLIPWAFFLVNQCVRTGRLRSLLLLSITLSMMYSLYAGIWYYVVLGVVGYAGWQCWQRQKIRSGVMTFLLFSMLHLSMISIMLLPQFALREETTRSLMTIEDIAIPQWSMVRLASHILFPIKDEVLETASESMLFVGWSVLLLLFLGWLRLSLRMKVVVAFFIGLAVAFFGGTRFPLFPWAAALLPGFKYMRGTTRGFLVFLLLLMPLVHLGWGRLRPRLRTVFMLIVIVELFLVGWWWVFSTPLPQPTSSQLIARVEGLVRMGESRVYCTTHCLPQREMSARRIRLLDGNFPIQFKSAIRRIQEAGGYTFNQFSVIHPPYQVYPQEPQPNARLLAELGVGVVVSPYAITDRDFVLVGRIDDYFLYQNTRYKTGRERRIIPDDLFQKAVQWFYIGAVLSMGSLIAHGGLWLYGFKRNTVISAKKIQ